MLHITALDVTIAALEEALVTFHRWVCFQLSALAAMFPSYWTATLLSIFTWTVAGANTEAWKSRNIYFALTDRIARGPADNGGEACGNLGNYCGGTFKGLESKLDYISGMGFDAIWITPVVENSPGGYHGYWAKDLYSINPNYGTADDLKDLVGAAHERGMFVMVDVVANHMGQGDISDNRPEPLNEASSYHPKCDIDYNNQSSIEECRIAGLPDLYTQKTEIRTLLQDWVKWLVQEYNIDGIRIDTVKHIEKDFWPDFVDAAGVYSIGEVWDGNPHYLSEYAKLMPGLLNYAIYYPMNNFYQQRGSAQDIVKMHKEIDSLFPDPSAFGTFLDNHDNKRWLAQKDDKTLLKNALAYVILARGIPIVYYGTEQGYAGGDDPQNREDLWRSEFDRDADLYQSINRLSKARTGSGGLSADDHVHLYATNNAYAWSRAAGKLVVLTTNTGAGTSGQYCFNSLHPNRQWIDIFATTSESDSQTQTYSSDPTGNLCLTVTNGEPIVLLSTTTDDNSSSSTLSPTVTATPQPPSTSQPQQTCPITFKIRVLTAYGDTIKLVGNTPVLGDWDVAAAPALSAEGYTETDPLWSGTVLLDTGRGEVIRYKFVNVKTGEGGVEWEADPDRVYSVPTDCGDGDVVVVDGGEWQ